ncbi:MAG: hypothetical protein ACOCZ5_01485 [bacterium]
MDEEKREFAHMRVDKETRDILYKLKIYRRETFDEVIIRLANFYLETKSKEKPKEE